MAEPADRRPVTLTVVQDGRQEAVSGWAHAWTASAVFVAWRDSQGLQHLDWFHARDVQAG